jgi:hypothetical protein
MPRRKPKAERLAEERLKQNLDSILMEESMETDIPVNSPELPRIKSTDLMDFDGEKSSAATDAKALLDSLANFYVDIERDGADASHMDLKKKMDAMNIAAMMFQLKTAQHSIIKILEEIDLGNTNPRLFEVLAQMQSQIMQMPKDYQAYLEKTEQNYKKSRIEIDEKRQSNRVIMDKGSNGDNYYVPSNDSNQPEGNGIRSRGTRGIMEGLRGIIGSEVVDITAEIVDPNAVVNAKQKKIIDSGNPNLKNDDLDDDIEAFIIDDDLLK